MSLIRIEAPAAEPVTIAEVKSQANIDHSDDDALIAADITAAREEVEHYLGRPLITQTWERVLDAFPADAILLGWGPVQSIASIKYIDTDGVQQTMDAADYSLDKDSNEQVGFVLRAATITAWPSTLDTANAVRVRFVAGYGATAADVPMLIRKRIIVRAASTYKHRDETVVGTIVASLPDRFHDRMLDRYRVCGLKL